MMSTIPTRRERQEERRREREEKSQVKQKKRVRTQTTKTVITWVSIVIASVGLLVVLISIFSTERGQPYSGGVVHWHATLKVSTCGEKQEMPKPVGEHHVGLQLLHTHEDQLIHIEGTVWKPEDITLEAYMKAIGKKFADTELLDKKNGDLCEGKPGKVKLFVNGEENNELTRYVIKDGENYELVFES